MTFLDWTRVIENVRMKNLWWIAQRDNIMIPYLGSVDVCLSILDSFIRFIYNSKIKNVFFKHPRTLFVLLQQSLPVWTMWRLTHPAAWSPALASLSPASINLNRKRILKLYFQYLESTRFTKKLQHIHLHRTVLTYKALIYALEINVYFIWY